MAYKELPCLREMRVLIEEERAGDKYINRLLLIYITSDTIDRIFALRNNKRQMQLAQSVVPMDIEVARFWHNDAEPEYMVWEFVPMNINGYYLYRREIDAANKQIRFTRYQITFSSFGHKEIAYSKIMLPTFVYNNILGREQPEDVITFDYTELEYEHDGKTVSAMTFTRKTALGIPMTLKPVKKPELLRHYEAFIDHTDYGADFADIDNYGEYNVELSVIDVAVSDTAIFFQLDDGVYKMYKFYDDGTETFAGIDVLTHKDNFVFAKLYEHGRSRHFLCLDSINQNLDYDELLKHPAFCKLKRIADVFE